MSLSKFTILIQSQVPLSLNFSTWDAWKQATGNAKTGLIAVTEGLGCGEQVGQRSQCPATGNACCLRRGTEDELFTEMRLLDFRAGFNYHLPKHTEDRCWSDGASTEPTRLLHVQSLLERLGLEEGI